MSKTVLYDWFGYNKILFGCINNLTENIAVLKILKFISDYIGHYMMFPMHICILVVAVYFLTHSKNKNVEKDLLYIKSMIVLLATLTLFMTLGQFAKSYFAFARPYCSPDIKLNPALKFIITNGYNAKKCLQSMPSGHTMYVTAFVLSMWPSLNKQLKIIGSITIVIVAFSRIALGMHFPADVFYGFILSASSICLVRFVVEHTILKPTLRKLKDALHI